jgi:4-diphosphocytidyl-2C-methyl-D-erythritol kinase
MFAYLMCFFREGLSTALVFKTMNLGACSSVNPDNLLGAFQKAGALQAAADGQLINDLEPPAFQCQPLLLNLKAEIERAGDGILSGVMMSGSGTSVYALSSASSKKELDVASILTKFPSVKYFPCTFLNKKDDNQAWY